MARPWTLCGLFLLGCGPTVQLPSGGGADDGSGGHEAGSTGERITGAGEDTDTHTPPDSEGDDGAISSGSSSTGEDACACGSQRLNETKRIGSLMSESFIQASVTRSAIWTRAEWAEGGGMVTRHGHDDSFTQWHDQAFSLHAPARMVASDAGAAFGEYVPLDEVWRLQLFDDQGSRVCYLDYDAPLFPTLAPPGEWAFLQPGLAATLLPALCDVDQAETLSLAAVPTDLDILDAAWTSEFLVVLGSRETETGQAPVAVTLDRIDGSLRATTDIPAPAVGYRWSPSNEGILLTLRDEETIEALALEPATGALTLLGQVDGAGVTEAVALPHPTDPWLLLNGDDPRVVRLSEDPCCPPMALELYATTLRLHTARRIDDALMLVRDYDDGNHMLGRETYTLE